MRNLLIQVIWILAASKSLATPLYQFTPPGGAALGARLDSSLNILGTTETAILKFSSKGNVLWESPIPQEGADKISIFAIQLDPMDNIYATFYIWLPGKKSGSLDNTDFKLMKFDSKGKLLWKTKGPGHPQHGWFDKTGNFYLAHKEEKSAQGVTFVLTKYDKDGNVVAKKSSPAGGYGISFQGAVDPAGNIYVLSDGLLYKFRPDYTEAWKKQLLSQAQYCPAMSIDSKGNLIVLVSGGAELPNGITILKISSEGQVLWKKTLVNEGDTSAETMAVGADDSVFIGGNTSGSFDNPTVDLGFKQEIFLAKFNSIGDRLWNKQFGSGADENFNDLKVDKNGDASLLAMTSGTFPGFSKEKYAYALVTIGFDTNGSTEAKGSNTKMVNGPYLEEVHWKCDVCFKVSDDHYARLSLTAGDIVLDINGASFSPADKAKVEIDRLLLEAEKRSISGFQIFNVIRKGRKIETRVYILSKEQLQKLKDVDAYNQLATDVENGKATKVSIEDLYLKADEASSILENLAAEGVETRKSLKGFSIERGEVVVYTAVDIGYFSSLAARRGRPADTSFFKTIKETSPDGESMNYEIWGSHYGPCISYGSGDLVSAYKAWTNYAKNFPKHYATTVNRKIENVTKGLTEPGCVCQGDKDPVIRELKMFLSKNPKSSIEDSVRSAIINLESGRANVKFDCHPG